MPDVPSPIPSFNFIEVGLLGVYKKFVSFERQSSMSASCALSLSISRE